MAFGKGVKKLSGEIAVISPEKTVSLVTRFSGEFGSKSGKITLGDGHGICRCVRGDLTGKKTSS